MPPHQQKEEVRPFKICIDGTPSPPPALKSVLECEGSVSSNYSRATRSSTLSSTRDGLNHVRTITSPPRTPLSSSSSTSTRKQKAVDLAAWGIQLPSTTPPRPSSSSSSKKFASDSSSVCSSKSRNGRVSKSSGGSRRSRGVSRRIPESVSEVEEIGIDWSALALLVAQVALIVILFGVGIRLGQKILSISNDKLASMDHKSLFQHHASQVLEESASRIVTAMKVFHGFGTSVQQIARYSNQAWPFITIPHWQQRAAPILKYTKADSLILAPLVTPRQWDPFYTYTNHLHDEKLHWQAHFQSLFVPWQKAPDVSKKEGSALALREWYSDPATHRIMDIIPSTTHPALLLRSVNASFDYLFQPIIDVKGHKKNAEDGDAPVITRTRKQVTRLVGRVLGRQEQEGKEEVVGIVAAQVRLESHIQESLGPLLSLLGASPSSSSSDINNKVSVVAVLEDNCGTKTSFHIAAYRPDEGPKTSNSTTSTSTFLGVGDFHDDFYDDFGVVSDEISTSTNGAAAAVAANMGCYPTGLKIRLYPTAQTIHKVLEQRNTLRNLYARISIEILAYVVVCYAVFLALNGQEKQSVLSKHSMIFLKRFQGCAVYG